MEALYQNLPLIVAGSGLILGTLLCRYLVKFACVARLWPVAVMFLLVYFSAGEEATNWMIVELASLEAVSLTVSKQVSIGLVTFVTGFAIGLFINKVR